MKRKLISIITALALCLSLLPGMAWAAGTVTVTIDGITLVSGNKYVPDDENHGVKPWTNEADYLEFKIDERDSTKGILTVHGTIELPGGGPPTLSIRSGTLTIIGDGNPSLKLTSKGPPAISGNLTIKSVGNVTIENENGMAVVGDLTIENAGDVTITSENNYAVTGALAITSSGTVTITGGAQNGPSAISGSISITADGDITITDRNANSDYNGAALESTNGTISVTGMVYYEGQLWKVVTPDSFILLDLSKPARYKTQNGTICYTPTDGTTPATMEITGDNTVRSIAVPDNLTLTGSGSLTVSSSMQIGGTLDTSKFSGTLNAFAGTAGDVTVYGTVALPTDASVNNGHSMTIREDATLTINSGNTLTISDLDALIVKEGGTIENNGTITIEAGAIHDGMSASAAIKGLNITDGKENKSTIVVKTTDAEGNETTTDYTNDGAAIIEEPLDFSDKKTTIDELDTKGYKWEVTTAEDEEGHKTYTYKLILDNVVITKKVTLPDGDVTIYVTGDCTIKELEVSGTYSAHLTVDGTGKLTVEEKIDISNGNDPSLTVTGDATLEAKKRISVAKGGGINGTVTVNGNGTLTAAGSKESGYDMPAVSAGKVVVGDTGRLEVSGETGVQLGGMSESDDPNTNFNGAFTLKENGTFIADCEGNAIEVFDSLAGNPLEGLDPKDVIVVPPDYLPAGHEPKWGNDAYSSIIIEGGEFEISSANVPPTYSITVTTSEGGTISGSASPASATAGTRVSLAGITTTPEEGYAFDGWTSNEVTVAADGTFTMPEGNVTITATWKEEATEPEPGPGPDEPGPGPDEPGPGPDEPGPGPDEPGPGPDEPGPGPDEPGPGPDEPGPGPDEPGPGPDEPDPGPDVPDPVDPGPGNPDPVGPIYPVYPVYPAGSNSTPTTYPVRTNPNEHGTVTTSPKNAGRDTLVTVTVKPDAGYELASLNVTDSRGDAVTLTAQGGGKYTFTMPGRAVTVMAVFTPLPAAADKPCDGGADCPSRAFSDLDTGKWYHGATDYVLRNGFISGYGSGQFGPNDNLTRAQLAQILYNMAGKPAVTGGSVFTDVADGQWYTPAIIWAASNGIVSGYGDGQFGPNDYITREQLAVMLWRYAGSPAAAGSELPFRDAGAVSAYALEAIRWAAENGILSGHADGLLAPQGLATRAQTAQMLKNYMSE